MSLKDLNKLTAGSLVLTGFLLAGCSSSGYYYDRETDYVDAREYPALKLPASADNSRFKQAMPLPEILAEEPLHDEFVVPRPDALPVLDEDLPLAELKNFSIGSSVDAAGLAPRLWLSVANTPSVVWPLLQSQLEHLGWRVLTANPSNGRIRFLPDNQLNPQPVDAVLRQGLRGGFSDLELLNSRGEVRTDSDARSLLTQISTDLDQRLQSAQSVSLLAQNISREKTIVLQASGGRDPVLKLGTDADRTWIGLQLLLQENFTDNEQKLLASDPAERRFTLVWVPEEDRSSILTRWASSPGPEYHYQLELTGSAPVAIRVRQNGKPVIPRQARQILSGVRKLLN